MAFLRAQPARFRAPLAVFLLEFFTFGVASVADLRAGPADFLQELRAAAHEAGRRPADRRAVQIQANTLRPVGEFGMLEAGGRTVLAFAGAANAGVNAGLMVFVIHHSSSSDQCLR